MFVLLRIQAVISEDASDRPSFPLSSHYSNETSGRLGVFNCSCFTFVLTIAVPVAIGTRGHGGRGGEVVLLPFQ